MMKEMKRMLIVAGIVIVIAVVMMAVAEPVTNAITVNAYLKVANKEFQKVRNVNQYKVTQQNLGSSAGIQSIQTTAWEVIVIEADVATNGYAFFLNATTNRRDRWIDVGPSNGATPIAMMRLYGDDAAVLPLHPVNTLYARAGSTVTNVDITSVLLEKWILQD